MQAKAETETFSERKGENWAGAASLINFPVDSRSIRYRHQLHHWRTFSASKGLKRQMNISSKSWQQPCLGLNLEPGRVCIQIWPASEATQSLSTFHWNCISASAFCRALPMKRWFMSVDRGDTPHYFLFTFYPQPFQSGESGPFVIFTVKTTRQNLFSFLKSLKVQILPRHLVINFATNESGVVVWRHFSDNIFC